MSKAIFQGFEVSFSFPCQLLINTHAIVSRMLGAWDWFMTEFCVSVNEHMEQEKH